MKGGEERDGIDLIINGNPYYRGGAILENIEKLYFINNHISNKMFHKVLD